MCKEARQTKPHMWTLTTGCLCRVSLGLAEIPCQSYLLQFSEWMGTKNHSPSECSPGTKVRQTPFSLLEKSFLQMLTKNTFEDSGAELGMLFC